MNEKIAEINKFVREVQLHGWSRCPKQFELYHHIEFLLSELDRMEHDISELETENRMQAERNKRLEKEKQKLIEGIKNIRKASKTEIDYPLLLIGIGIKCDSILEELGVTVE